MVLININDLQMIYENITHIKHLTKKYFIIFIGDYKMKEELTYISKDNKTTIHGYIYKPLSEPKGIIHFIHGINETMESDMDFVNTFNNLGYIICGIDLLGNGKSILDEKHINYFVDDKKEIVNTLIEDMNQFKELMIGKYPNLNYYVLGLSLGSLIARLLISKYPKNVTGLIVIGSPYMNNLSINFDMIIIDYLALSKDWYDRNVFLNKTMSRKFSKYFEEHDQYAWVTSNIKAREKMKQVNTYKYTNNGLYGILALLKEANKAKSYENFPKDLPIMLMTGKDDAVTMFSDYTFKQENKYKKHKCTNTRVKIYNGLRHNLLQENNEDLIIHDIHEFIEKNKNQ
jgi:alpha-beta hydrolase superfamily lysophospholipase